jgi:hypothetical protein
VTTAAHIWSKTNTAVFSRDERAAAAMREITRLEDAIASLRAEIRNIEHRDDIPRWQMTGRQNMQIEWATTDLASTRAELQTILKE